MINKNSNFGFTLIEILVAASIVIALSTIVVGVLTTTFRTSNKTTFQEEVRKNGNYAINQVTKLVQFADNFESAYEGGLGGFGLACSDPSIEYKYIKVNSDGNERTVGCFDDNGNNEGIYLDGKALINLDSVNVKAGSCKLKCSMNTLSSSPVIGLDFTLTLADNAKSKIPEGNINIDFSTSIKMRNF